MILDSNFFWFIYIIPMIFGMGGGMLTGLFIFGLIGGLVGILLYKRKILRLPNYKINIFAGYLVFSLFLFILPFSYQGARFPLFCLPFLHIIVILVFLTLFDKKKICSSLYWSFVLSYFLACFALGFIPFLLNFSPFYF
jgi:hypothetical protein